jgi:hypothetical protein
LALGLALGFGLGRTGGFGSGTGTGGAVMTTIGVAPQLGHLSTQSAGLWRGLSPVTGGSRSQHEPGETAVQAGHWRRSAGVIIWARSYRRRAM